MSSVHWHLMLTHVPVVGTLIGVGLSLVALRTKNMALLRAVLGLFMLCALVTVPVYLTGEPAEESVEHLPGVAEALIEQHEGIAKLALVCIGALGAVSLAGLGLLRKAQAVPVWFSTGLVSLSILCSAMMGYTANLGGQVRHSEIRSASFADNPEVDEQRVVAGTSGQTGEEGED